MLSNDVSEIAHRDDKLPHDASVFVGSLPSNIDQGELTRMLIEHLSEHIQVKNIKVVRDSKGGVCAFVQCENAVSAAALIQTLHLGVPKPFLGRILRYEPARAFRTLLISYRTPTRIIRPVGVNTPNTPPYSSEVKLELPRVMRVWKHRNSRFHSISYNADAIQSEETYVHDDYALENAIFLNPLDFGKESLHRLVSYFGPLEKICLFQSTNVDVDKENAQFNAEGSHGGNVSYLSYPVPHNAVRSPSMDSGCWEVKWEHRDDCVSALMTLRRVPHLTVTWAHQPAPVAQGLPSNYQEHSLLHSFSGQLRILHSHGLTSTNGSLNARTHSQPSKTGIEMNTCTVDRAQTLSSETLLEAESDGLTSNTSTDSSGTPREKQEPKCPPISLDYQASWANRDSCSASGLIEDERPMGSATDSYNERGECRMEIMEDTKSDKGQELYIPQTPGLDKASTPITPGSQFPVTPTSYAEDESQEIDYTEFNGKNTMTYPRGLRTDREIDPTTLFVGGLEMFGPGAWDEEKVKNFFSRFGGLESVKVVRPLNSCAAFAFVKFNNADAPARAVLEEHNRVHDGRAMRVQLRDCNPPRNNWKYGRGRGRHHQNQYGVNRRFHYRPSYDVHDAQLQNVSKQIFHDPSNIPDGQFSSLASTMSSINLSSSSHNDIGSGSTEPTSSSDISLGNRNNASSEKYREWYDERDSSTHTPEPSLVSSASLGGLPLPTSPYVYPVPQGQYYPSQPWLQPYISQSPYQVPYYPGYAMYPPAAQHPSHQGLGSPSGIDVTGAPALSHAGWPQMGVYTSYIPYPTVFPRPNVIDQTQIPTVTSQAPLIPTGFIQNEQGTLIPVYQPEALDQYMASSGGTSVNPPNRHPTAVPQRFNNISPYPHESSSVQTNTCPQFNQGYNKPKPVGIPHSFPQQFSELRPSSTPIRVNDTGANTMPLYRRGHRREMNHSYNSARHPSNPRSYNGRVARGHMNNSGQMQSLDLGQSSNAAAALASNWNRWNGTR